ncbi:MAG: phage virion morphogenesis protein [Candidatus Odyssella sp.]|nr:phage virion morphogenesis protein [Candidatus Odyssella sp.]
MTGAIAIAQLGAGRFEMPARPFIGFDDADKQIVENILADRLKEALEKL